MHDVVIVGAGPAGCSAAWVCSQAGLQVLVVSANLDAVFLSDSDPVRLDAAASELCAALELPGTVPARDAHRSARWLLEQQPGIHLLQASVSAVLTESGRVTGVETWEGPVFTAPLVGLCVGSFLDASLEAGALQESAGRPGQMAYPELAENLRQLGLELRPARYAFTTGSGPGAVSSLVLGTAGAAAVLLEQPAGLGAAGYCVDPQVSFSGAAAAGQELGRLLAAQARAVS